MTIPKRYAANGPFFIASDGPYISSAPLSASFVFLVLKERRNVGQQRIPKNLPVYRLIEDVVINGPKILTFKYQQELHESDYEDYEFAYFS